MKGKSFFAVLLLFALAVLPHRALFAKAGPPSDGEKKAAQKAVKRDVPELIASYRKGLPGNAAGPRYFIIRDLGLSKDKRAVPFLISLVETGDLDEKGWAIDALAVHGDTEAVPVLARVLENPGSLTVPGRGKTPSNEPPADGYAALQVHAIKGLMRMHEELQAYPWIEKLVFEQKINVLPSLVDPQDRRKGLLTKLVFRDGKAKDIMLRALDSDDIDISLTAAYYLAENGYRNDAMFRVVDRAWKTARGDPRGGGVIRGRVVGTLMRINTRKAKKKLSEIERYLGEEKRRRAAAAGR